MNSPVFVTQSALPKEETYLEYVRQIFQSHGLTNNGVFCQRLERELEAFLGVRNLSVCSNGTLALQLAIKMLGINGKKVITTPFTYVATVTALMWENCEPIFADIDPQTLCLDPARVESILLEQPDIGGIMPVHVYGNACDVQSFADISQKYGVPVVYDAAHAFGSRLNGKSLLSFGDAATCSFHATKLFHTVEGGCIVTSNTERLDKLNLLRAFGHIGDNYSCPGINAKLSELHAAMGLSLLPDAPDNLRQRARLASLYDEALNINGNPALKRPVLAKGLQWNHAYYPVLFATSDLLLTVIDELHRQDIHPRRYFHPSLTELPYLPRQSCPVAEDAASRVLCLPFWADMPDATALRVAQIVNSTTAGFA